MSSALKPALTPAGSQNPSVPSQLNKPMHPQGGPPTTYGQPMSHIPQNLVNIPHNPSSSSVVHNPAHSNLHHLNTNSAHPSSNHYSLNVPNAQHYPVSGNAPVSAHSGHPISNPNQAHFSNNPTQAHTQPAFSGPPKNLSFNPSYQANLGHSYKPVNPIQNVAVSQPQAAVEEKKEEKPQSNGTPEVKVDMKETSQNHVPVAPVKDKPQVQTQVTPPLPAPVLVVTPAPPSVPSPAPPQVAAEKPKPLLEKPLVQPVVTVQQPSPEKQVESVKKALPEKPEDVPTSESISITDVSLKTSTAPSSDSGKSTPTSVSASTSVVSTPSPPKQEAVMTFSVETPKPPEPTKSKEQVQVSQKSTLKLATTPRIIVRKPKPSKVETLDVIKTPKTDSKSPSNKSPSTSSGKVKRNRIRTQPYQSPLPEVEFISKISATIPRNKNNDDKLIVFYKNEFLAVRNSEGSFYVCQAVQNIYKSSSKIRIRWLSQDKNDKEIYTPDFYDYTDFDCILTNLNLNRVDKGKFKLPPQEKVRTDSILKRALAVETGDATPPSLTEEHPDGLDLSLYKEESQLQKRKPVKRKPAKRKASPLKTESTSADVKSPDQPKVRKVIKAKPQPKKSFKSTPTTSTSTAATIISKKVDTSRADRAKKRNQEVAKSFAKISPVIDAKKAKVLAKVARKPPVQLKIQPPPKQVSATKVKPPPPAKKVVKKEKKEVLVRKSKRGKK